MRPTTAVGNVFDINALLHPGTVFEHPQDVVGHSGLTTAEKRAILALGVGCFCHRVLPVQALSCGTENARVDRRNIRGSMRLGRRSANSSRRKALPVALDRTRYSRLKLGVSFRSDDGDRRETGSIARSSQQ